MELFDKISDAVVSAGKDLGKKAGELGDVAKLKYEIKSKESEVRVKYRELGEKYFAEHKDDADDPKYDVMKEIQALTKEIEGLEEAVMDAQGAAACPNCGAKVKPGMTFCSNCGTKVDSLFDVMAADDAEEVEDADAEIVDEDEA